MYEVDEELELKDALAEFEREYEELEGLRDAVIQIDSKLKTRNLELFDERLLEVGYEIDYLKDELKKQGVK